LEELAAAFREAGRRFGLDVAVASGRFGADRLKELNWRRDAGAPLRASSGSRKLGDPPSREDCIPHRLDARAGIRLRFGRELSWSVFLIPFPYFEDMRAGPE